MTAFDHLIESIGTDTPLPPDVAEELLELHPYLTVAAARALLNSDLTDSRRQSFLNRVALGSPDTASLMSLIDPDGATFAKFYPSNTAATPSTESAIDTFLDTYGHGADPREEALLERLIFNPTPDYSEVLARQAATETEPAPDSDQTPQAQPASQQDALLDAFLSSQGIVATPPPATEETPPPPPEHHPKPNAEAPLSESLAKIFIKRGRYDKAYEIIRQLSLNFPEKSVYFADQLRFLRKLILNQQFAKAKK